MLPLVAGILFFYLVFVGAPMLALLLVGSGFLLSVVLAIRLANSLRSGTGGHAEWLRDVTSRADAIRSPGWVLALGLVVVGTVLGFFSP